jgi:type IV pilus assembly protein PilB
MSTQIADLLTKLNIVSADQLNQARESAQKSGSSVVGELVSLGLVEEDKYLNALARHFNVKRVKLEGITIDQAILKLLQPDFCVKHCLMPLRRSGQRLSIAIANPANLFAIDTVRFMTNYNVEPFLCSDREIMEGIEKFYGTSTRKDSLTSMMNSLGETTTSTELEVADDEEEINIADLEKSTQEAPVVKLVNVILHESVQRGASDIHIEPYEKDFRVRFRIDGILYEVMRPPMKMKDAIISRIKILSKLDISEKRLPQDGRIMLKFRSHTGVKELDLRVSVLPVLFGEKIVMRLLDKGNLMLDMTKLGFEQHSLDIVTDCIHKPYGMVLVTGPTGSGKTNTLYSALGQLNNAETNIMTAEDPVEFNIEGINQVQTKEKIGLSFASALRSFLRQDPNIVMVGEIRDFETAEIAIKAALTGHLVFSTLHTNDAPSSIIRLMNMGVEPFLVSTSVLAIVAQRLVRRICKECKEQVDTPEKALIDIGFTPEEVSSVTIYRGAGCKKCNETGYKGRVGLFEVLKVTQSMRNAILSGSNTEELKALAIKEGMITLRRSGLEKIKLGITTVEEVLRETIG